MITATTDQPYLFWSFSKFTFLYGFEPCRKKNAKGSFSSPSDKIIYLMNLVLLTQF